VLLVQKMRCGSPFNVKSRFATTLDIKIFLTLSNHNLLTFLNMKMTKELIMKKLQALPKLYETDNLEPKKIKVPIKLYDPFINFCFYLTEYDSDTQLAFGFANLDDEQSAELGYINIKKILSDSVYIMLDNKWNPENNLEQVMHFKKS